MLIPALEPVKLLLAALFLSQRGLTVGEACVKSLQMVFSISLAGKGNA